MVKLLIPSIKMLKANKKIILTLPFLIILTSCLNYDCFDKIMSADIEKIEWQGVYEYSTYQIVESTGTGVGEDYTIKISDDVCHIEIAGFQVYRQFDCYIVKNKDHKIISIYQTDNKKEFGEIKYKQPHEYFINIKFYDEQTGVDDSFDKLEKVE